MTPGHPRTCRAGIMSAALRPTARRGLAAAGLALGLAGAPALQAAAPEARPEAVSGGEAGAEGSAPAPGYEFGHGLRLGHSGFTLGGYLTGEVHQLRGEATQVKSSHASAFLWWEGEGPLKFFAELDFANLAARRRGDDDRDSDRRLSLERLYLDYVLSDALTLRAGKFLTPIGRWNLRHADPLVWTTNRPLLTQSVFPHNVTGVMASGTLLLRQQPLSYSLYASNGAEWNADPAQDPFSVVRGLRAVVPAGPAQLGLSYARYEQRGSRGEPRALAGLDLFWAVGRSEFSAEWLRTSTRGGAQGAPPGEPRVAVRPRTLAASAWAAERGNPRPPGLGGWGASRAAYVQAVVPLQGQLFAVGRYEWMRDARLVQTVQQSVLGLAWRPTAATSVKLELLRARQRNPAVPDGLAASVSLLF